MKKYFIKLRVKRRFMNWKIKTKNNHEVFFEYYASLRYKCFSDDIDEV